MIITPEVEIIRERLQHCIARPYDCPTVRGYTPTVVESMTDQPQRRPCSSKQISHRASIACLPCRQRRTRCDGDSRRNKPCSFCVEAKTPCHFPHHDGRKRRRSDMVRLHQGLVGAIKQAQSRGLDLSNPSIAAELIESLRSPLRQSSSLSNTSTLSTNRDGGNVLDSTCGPLDTRGEILLNTQAMHKDSALFKPDVRIQGKDSGSLVPVLSSTELVWLSTDLHGQVRYFGYTSNMQVVSTLPVAPDSPIFASQSLPNTHNDSADLPEFQNHLVDLYFTYQNPALPIVQRDAFMEGWASQEPSQYFSNFLLHCILARSVRLSERPCALSLVTVYHQRIKSEIAEQIENPSIATIQALCLYGHFLGSIGDDRGCWLYPGMAFRLTYDMGLHRDCLNLLQTGKTTSRDRQMRISTFWGCYVLDKIYSLCQGRPSAIKMEDVSLPRPCKDSVGPHCHLLAAWVDLAAILDDMNAILNRPQGELQKDTSLMRLSDVASKLLHWLKALPPGLRWSQEDFPSPEVCALHTQALIAIVLIHRPFARSASSISVPSIMAKKQLPGYTAEDSHNVCIRNSIRIAKMIDAFKRRYGIQKIFSVGAYIALTAAMTLVSDVIPATTMQTPNFESKKALDVCLDALTDLGPSFPVAGRHHTILRSVMKFCGYQRERGDGEDDEHTLDDKSTRRPEITEGRAQRSTARSSDGDFGDSHKPTIDHSSMQSMTTKDDDLQMEHERNEPLTQPLVQNSLSTMGNTKEVFSGAFAESLSDSVDSEIDISEHIAITQHLELMQQSQHCVSEEQQVHDLGTNTDIEFSSGTNPSTWFVPQFDCTTDPSTWLLPQYGPSFVMPDELEATSMPLMPVRNDFNMTMLDLAHVEYQHNHRAKLDYA